MTDEPQILLEDTVKVHELSIPAEEGQLSRVRDFVAEVCEEAGFSARETNNTKLAVEYCLKHPRWRLSLQTHKLLGIP